MVFLLLAVCPVRPGTSSAPAGVVQPRRQPLWVAQKEPKKSGAARTPDSGKRAGGGTAVPAPATGNSRKSSPPAAPLSPFKPSEKIKAGQPVDFPADI